jgi:hypothetical protein
MHRRSFIGLGMGGIASVLGLDRAVLAASGRAQAKSVLVIFEQGGLSHIDTFDPKPEAPAEHRSPFRPIRTAAPDMQFTELLTHTAKHADKLSAVRCMTQPTPGIGNSHPNGSRYIFSGEAPGGPVEMPDIGSVVVHRGGPRVRHLPGNILLPGVSIYNTQSTAGFLPPGTAAFKVGGRNLLDPGWKVPSLSLLTGIDERRFTDRRDLLGRLDIGLIGGRAARDAQAMAALSEQAQDMLTNPATRRAFDLQAEPAEVRDAYGRSHRGQCYLMARKLIEAGVRFVTVDVQEPPDNYEGAVSLEWDHHDHIYSDTHTNLPNGGPGLGRWGIHTWPMMGCTDVALAALLGDMHDRGLLDETLVCFVTEFGRTPKINDRKGRDHWTHAFTFAFAGAGVPGGQVVGATDREGGYITSPTAYTIEDYGVTIYAKLGIDVTQPVYTPDGRPVYVGAKGRPIAELF